MTAEEMALQLLNDREFERSSLRDDDGMIRPEYLVFWEETCQHTVSTKPIPIRFPLPVHLHVELPHEYPSTNIPKFELRCIWLSQRELEEIDHRLRQVWSPGSVVVYSWIEEILEHIRELGRRQSNQILIGSPCVICQSSSKAIHNDPEITFENVERTLMDIIRYDRLKRKDDLRDATVTCEICFQDKLGRYFQHLGCCEHIFCRDCMAEMAQISINDGSVLQLQCPNCKAQIAPHIIHSLTDEQSFLKYQKLLIQRTMERFLKAVYCPRCELNGLETSVAPLEGIPDLCVCSRCSFSFCPRCRDEYHPSTQCFANVSTEVGEVDLERKPGYTESLKKIKDKRQQALNISLIMRTTKPCAACGTAVEKESGCNKMSCVCGAYFCYRCGAKIDGYDHFWEGKCQLFEQEDIRRWERQQLPQRLQLWEQRRNGFQNNHQQAVARCPNCHAEALKIGTNNHVNCFQCGHHFCFLCRSILRKGESASHFGVIASRCRQHT
eukprot:c6357_g1_i3.p1 GENE.c6357_g1_i3~~c6357_g1_i3.p1  ORF type:complete len:549 (-),score=110.44 c6357_g1_i3:34-1521(-)